MTKLSISSERFEKGELPEVCAKTGRIARNRFAATAAYVPGWTRALLPFGVVPYVVAAAITRRSIDGALPLSQPAAARLSMSRFSAVLCGGTALLLALCAVVFSSMNLAWVAFAVFVGFLASLATAFRLSVGIKLSAGGKEVTFHRVHSDFVAAVSAPPSKCVGCTSSSGCSVVEMDACDGVLSS